MGDCGWLTAILRRLCAQPNNRAASYTNPERILLQALERRVLLSAGFLDPTFGSAGTATLVTNEPASAAALAPDGKIVFAGTATNVSSSTFGVTRLNTNGSIDTTFGVSGSAGIDLEMPYVTTTSIAVQPDGKILLGGTEQQASSYRRWVIARFNGDGSVDTTFGSGGKIVADMGADGVLSALAVQSDGKIVSVGRAGATYPGLLTVARYNSDGSADALFGSVGRSTVTGTQDPCIPTCASLMPTGKILVAGEDDNGAPSLARLNADGSLDAAFGTGGVVESNIYIGTYPGGNVVTSIAVQNDGSVVATIASDGTLDGPLYMQRFTSSGGIDASFGGPTGIEACPWGMNPRVACQADGKIIFTAEADPSTPRFFIARYNPDGAGDPTFGTDGSGTISSIGSSTVYPSAVLIQPGDQIVVAGAKTGSLPTNAVVDRVIGGAVATSGASAFTVRFPRYIAPGLSGRVSITAEDANGHVATGFAGTVHFISSDANAILPPDYTFTAADQGVHTFDVTFTTPGTQTLTVTDLSGVSVGRQTGIVVHNSVSDFIPMAEPTSLVADPTRNRLYAPNAEGTVEVYDLNTQTLLPPIVLGGTLAGADITPDGKYLYVTAGFPHPNVQSIFYKVNLDDGTVSKIPTPANYSTSIAIGSDGTGLLTYGTANSLAYQIDTATDQITPINNLPGRTTQTLGGAGVFRTADRNHLVLVGAGYAADFDAAVGSFDAYTTTVNFQGPLTLPVSASAALIAQGNASVLVADSAWKSVTISMGQTGVLSDPNQNLLYFVANPNGSGPPPGIKVYNPTTGALVGSAPWTLRSPAPPIGTFDPNVDALAVVPDSSMLMIGTRGAWQWPGGIYLLHLGTSPIADPGGPYTVTEGGSVTLAASGSYDLSSSISQYEWDLNYDGVTFNPTATGATVTFSAAGQGPSARRIALRVTDAAGHSSISYTGLTITAATPTVTISGAGGASAGSSYTLNLSYRNVASDPAQSWIIGWGDGTAPQIVSGNPASVTHIFPLPADSNAYHVMAAVTSAGGTFSAQPLSVIVVPAPVVDASHTLRVYGSDEPDTITLSNTSGSLVVTVNGATSSFSPAGVSSIQVSALGGDDTVSCNGSVPVGTIDLGDGNDTVSLTGAVGQGATMSLVGGTGGDTFKIYGPGERATVDGGVGSDTVQLYGLAASGASDDGRVQCKVHHGSQLQCCR